MFTGTVAGQAAIFHPGDVPGYVSFTAWLPDTRTAIAVLSNDETTDLDSVVEQLLAAT